MKRKQLTPSSNALQIIGITLAVKALLRAIIKTHPNPENLKKTLREEAEALKDQLSQIDDAQQTATGICREFFSLLMEG